MVWYRFEDLRVFRLSGRGLGRESGQAGKRKMREEKEKLRKAIENLESFRLDRRVAAIEVLANLDSTESLRILLGCLHDESWHLRERVTKILGSQGKKVIPYLDGVIRKGLWYARASSAKSLGEIGEVEGMDLLLPLLEDESRIVRKEAQKALTKIISRDPTAVFNGYLSAKDPKFAHIFLERIKIFDQKGYEVLTRQEENG